MPNDTKRVTTRFNDEQMYLIERAAVRKGLAVAAFIRSCAVEKASEILGAIPEVKK